VCCGGGGGGGGGVEAFNRLLNWTGLLERAQLTVLVVRVVAPHRWATDVEWLTFSAGNATSHRTCKLDARNQKPNELLTKQVRAERKRTVDWRRSPCLEEVMPAFRPASC
jgi:hypothetical protein